LLSYKILESCLWYGINLLILDGENHMNGQADLLRDFSPPDESSGGKQCTLIKSRASLQTLLFIIGRYPKMSSDELIQRIKISEPLNN